ncbi:NYN domain-containing protein [Aquabacterium sp. NJ1]|uniref:NYN domain-containing protein n=1 Tax=Aquabacterium sp. NJ1 TaxID=1538295 RepID=UPI00126A5ACA|nr:NYN domain-containing protein [Aquabacterium sp. NJ1]
MSGSYLFIDGNYFQQAWEKFNSFWFDGKGRFSYPQLSAHHKKIFYYDALPSKKDNESDEEFGARLKAKHDFFNYLRGLSRWHVYEGISKRARGGIARQKEVDVLIAVDMLTHTHRKNMEELTFIAGDQDFRPLIDAVVREGMNVNLWYGSGSVSEDLKNTADSSMCMDVFSLHHFLDGDTQKSCPMPQRSGSMGEFQPHGRLIENGFRGDQLVARIRRDATFDHINSAVVFSGVYHSNYRVQGNLEFAKKVYAYEFGDIEWRPAGGE